MAALRGRYRCVSFDWPGHGRRSAFDPAGWTLDNLARDTADLIVHLDGGPAVLIGLSQGGMVFMRVALEHPELVRALVLLDTSARAEPPERVEAISANLVRLRDAPDEAREEFMRDFAVPAFFAEPWRRANPELVEREVALRTGHDRLGYELAARVVLDREPISLTRLAQLALPVVVIVGELDQLTPVDPARELASAIPGEQLVVVTAAGHHTPIEQPVRVTAIIEELLATL